MARSLYGRLTPKIFASGARRCAKQPTALERREFLKLTLAATAGLLVSPETTLAATARGRKVVVVGAGFGGLACADELVRHGCEVVILEARNRLGGRVISFTDIIPGKVVEGGGELIGSNHPTWLGFAKRFGLEFSPLSKNEGLEAPIVLHGRRLTGKEAKALDEEMEAAHRLMSRAAAGIDADEPWKSENAVRLDRRSTAQWIRSLPFSATCKRALTVEFAANNGVATSAQSFLGNLTQVKGGGLERYWTETEVYRCRGGNAQLAQKLAHALGHERLRFETAVREISVHDEKVIVCDTRGARHEADDVVLAIPPSTWHYIRFNPELPSALHPQMGVNVKYLAAVRNRFWLTSGLSPEALTDEIVSMTWEGTDHQGSDTSGAELTAFSGGPAAERARQHWAREKDSAYVAALTKNYPDFQKNFLRGRFMNWPNELWTGAGYSFPAPGQVTTVGPILRAGLGRLHFAGEHTCYKFVGYMEGALTSGVALAQRLVRQGGLATSLR